MLTRKVFAKSSRPKPVRPHFSGVKRSLTVFFHIIKDINSYILIHLISNIRLLMKRTQPVMYMLQRVIWNDCDTLTARLRPCAASLLSGWSCHISLISLTLVYKHIPIPLYTTVIYSLPMLVLPDDKSHPTSALAMLFHTRRVYSRSLYFYLQMNGSVSCVLSLLIT